MAKKKTIPYLYELNDFRFNSYIVNLIVTVIIYFKLFILKDKNHKTFRYYEKLVILCDVQFSTLPQ